MNTLRNTSTLILLLMAVSCSNHSEFRGVQRSGLTAKTEDLKPEVAEIPQVAEEPEVYAGAPAPEELPAVDEVLQPVPVPEAPLPAITLEVSLPSSEIKSGLLPLQAIAKTSRPATSAIVWTIDGPAGIDLGSIDGNGIYISPATATSEFAVTITASLQDDPQVKDSEVLKVLPNNQIFIGCKRGNVFFPITAEVYSLPVNTAKLPDYAAIQADLKTTVCMDKFDVPVRDFTVGFPEVPDLFEWFSLHTKTKIVIPTAGRYKFRLHADDGANLYIDGSKLIDNDGQHSQRSVDGAVELTAGDHEMVLDYFQGPRTEIALQLFWQTPGSPAMVIVPTASFKP